MVAAAGGIGGGGILVPIYILVLRFSPKYAVPLSNITIFGGAITNTFLNMKKRHPLADRPLVDWDLILVMEPLTSELLLHEVYGRSPLGGKFGVFWFVGCGHGVRT